MQVAHAMDGAKRKKPKSTFKKRRNPYRQSVGEDLDVVEADKVAKTNAEENKHRRTIILNRDGQEPWGFTVQSYGIHHKEEDEVELLTYIDYVAHNSPAFLAGMRQGDVILSINGTNMEDADHLALVEFVKQCSKSMRMVVLFENCCKKVELHLRYMKLKRVLAEKIFEVRSLEHQEMRIMSGMSRFDSFRSSRASSGSSNSFDDRLSLLPELDRCPTPRNSNIRSSLTSSLHDSESGYLQSPVFASSRSLSPLPQSGTRFDFDRLSLPMKKTKHRPHSLAATVSVHAALNASLKNGYDLEGSSGSSPNLNRRSPTFSFDASPIHENSDGDLSPGNIRRAKHKHRQHPTSSTPDYSLPPPNRSLLRSGRHASAPDKLNPPKKDLNEELELRLFKLHVCGAEGGESYTETDPDYSSISNSTNDLNSTNNPAAKSLLQQKLEGLQPKTSSSSLPQLSELGDKQLLGVKGGETRRSAISLNSSGGSAQFQVGSVHSLRCSSPGGSDPGTSYSLNEASSPAASDPGTSYSLNEASSIAGSDPGTSYRLNEASSPAGSDPGTSYRLNEASSPGGSDPGTSCSLNEASSSSDSSLSYPDLPVIEVELINDEDAVSHL